MEADELVGAAEIPERLGVKRSSVVFDWRQRHAAFPVPVATLEMGNVGCWPEIEAWARRSGRLNWCPGGFYGARLLDMDLAAEVLGRSTSKAYRLVKERELEIVKARHAWQVTGPALARFMNCDLVAEPVAARERRDSG